ncbi:MAG: NepR family anti-sigma factor [Novosphingobium sp.]
MPFDQARKLVTNFTISPTVPEPRRFGIGTKHVLAEREVMATAKKPRNQVEVAGGDPIAAALRQMHDSVASEDLPDDFLRLLGEIDARIAVKKAKH